MKLFYLFLTLILFNSFALHAQDLFLTVSGEFDGEKTSLDSISIENLANGTKTTLSNLPNQTEYRINLSKNALWGKTSVQEHLSKNGFKLITNQSGLSKVGYNGHLANDGTAEVYNSNGQKVFSTVIKKNLIDPKFTFRIGLDGIFIVKIAIDSKIQSYKTLGNTTTGKIDFEIDSNPNNGNIYKSSLGNNSSDFKSTLGDSLKVLPYKKGFTTTPQKTIVEGSEKTINFVLEENREGSFIDERDGKSYASIKMGKQIWMSENLAYLPDSLEVGSKSGMYVFGYGGNNTTEAKASENYKTFGVYYTWTAAMNGSDGSSTNPSNVRGVCPAGWHIPSPAEWQQLKDYLISQNLFIEGDTNKYSCAKALASKDYWSKNGVSLYGTPSLNPETNNSSGFNGIPTSLYYSNRDIPIGDRANWWSSDFWFDNNGIKNAYFFSMSINTNQFFRSGYENDTKSDYNAYRQYSVRCVSDQSEVEYFKPRLGYPSVVIKDSMATFYCGINSGGGDTITEMGFYLTSADKTATETDTVFIAEINSRSFKHNINGLKPNKTYRYRAFAKNKAGTGLSTGFRFKTRETFAPNETGSFIDTRDQREYSTVKIGEQWWMSENLAYLPSTTPDNFKSETEPAYYIPNYEGSRDNFYEKFGVLYNYSAAINACPTGWHLPKVDEWKILKNYLLSAGYNHDGTEFEEKAAKSLASETGWESSLGTGSPGCDSNLNNSTGFNALPAGYFNTSSKKSDSTNQNGNWWAAPTPGQANDYKGYEISYRIKYLSKITAGKYDGLSIRCIKD